MAVSDTRPFYLNLIKIRLPIAGVLSIFHRISGVFMFLAMPFLVYMLDLSLKGESGFSQAAEYLEGEPRDMADRAYRMLPFPRVPLYYLLW